jgi:hypothetical protein
LGATVAECRGDIGIDDQAIARIELMDPIANENYTLLPKTFHGRVSVVNGSLEGYVAR